MNQQEAWHRDVLPVCELVLGTSAHYTIAMTHITVTSSAHQIQVKPHKIHDDYYSVKDQWPLTVDANGMHGCEYGNVRGRVPHEKLSQCLEDILGKLPVQ